MDSLLVAGRHPYLPKKKMCLDLATLFRSRVFGVCYALLCCLLNPHGVTEKVSDKH
jgi:hypothetical protein